MNQIKLLQLYNLYLLGTPLTQLWEKKKEFEAQTP